MNAIEIADRQRARRTIGPVRRAASYLHKNADDAVRKRPWSIRLSAASS